MLSWCCQRQTRERRRARNALIMLEPAIGLEPMTCALRVRHPMSLRSKRLSHRAQKPNVFASHLLHTSISATGVTQVASCRATRVLLNSGTKDETQQW